MLAAEATRAGVGRAAARIGRDVGAIVALAAERIALHVEERRRSQDNSPHPRGSGGEGQGRNGAAARARDVRWTATWAAAAVGAAASLPSGPVLGVIAAALEARLLAEIESRARTRLLAIASGEEPGVHAKTWGSDTRRTMLRASVRKAMVLVSERAAHAGAKIVLKEVGLALRRLGLRSVIGPAAPVVAAAWSTALNALEMHHRLAPAVLAVGDAPSGSTCEDREAPARAFGQPAIALA